MSVSLGPAAAEADRGTVVLSDGGRVTGEIEVYLPGERVVVRTDAGEVVTLESARVAEVRFAPTGDAPSAALPPPPPATGVQPAYYGVSDGRANGRSDMDSATLLMLQLRRAELLARPHRVRPAVITLGVGAAMVLVGAVVFGTSYDNTTGEYSRSQDIAGLVLMPTGGVVFLAGLGLLPGRLRRQRQLEQNERMLESRGVSLTIGPSPAGAESYGLRAHFVF